MHCNQVNDKREYISVVIKKRQIKKSLLQENAGYCPTHSVVGEIFAPLSSSFIIFGQCFLWNVSLNTPEAVSHHS